MLGSTSESVSRGRRATAWVSAPGRRRTDRHRRANRGVHDSDVLPRRARSERYRTSVLSVTIGPLLRSDSSVSSSALTRLVPPRDEDLRGSRTDETVAAARSRHAPAEVDRTADRGRNDRREAYRRTRYPCRAKVAPDALTLALPSVRMSATLAPTVLSPCAGVRERNGRRLPNRARANPIRPPRSGTRYRERPMPKPLPRIWQVAHISEPLATKMPLRLLPSRDETGAEARHRSRDAVPR